LTGLVKELDKVVKENKGSTAVVILMADDKKAAADKLKAYAKEHGIEKVALTVNVTGSKSPNKYKVDDKVKHTVIAYTRKKVVENFALNTIDEKSTKEIIEKTVKVLKPAA
jgi:protein tyrosine phosphatase